jgi:hypothetical protein
VVKSANVYYRVSCFDWKEVFCQNGGEKWELVCVNVCGIGLGLSTGGSYFVRTERKRE